MISDSAIKNSYIQGNDCLLDNQYEIHLPLLRRQIQPAQGYSSGNGRASRLL